MNILALDTSQSVCSVALKSGDKLISLFDGTAKSSSNRLLAMIKSVINQADIGIESLDVIAFGQGPGSFTGLRIAAAVAQGLSFSHNIVVKPVCSLQAIAQGIYRRDAISQVVVLVDARMGEVYQGRYCFDGSQMQAVESESVIAPEQIDFKMIKGGGWYGAGSGWDEYRDELLDGRGWIEGVINDCVPYAEDIISLSHAAHGVDVSLATPIYLRNNVTHDGGKRG